MRRNRSKNTGPEMALRKALFILGVRGYRLHRRDIPGTPDIAFIGRKVAVFVHGCFWHGCPTCTRNLIPKANASYWSEKRARNQSRAERVESELVAMGWRVVVIWECEINQDVIACASRAQIAIDAQPKSASFKSRP